MHSIEDLVRYLGLSEYQIRARLREIDSVLDDHIYRGKKNRILIDDTGLKILERLRQLENEGLSVADSVQKIKEEMEELSPITVQNATLDFPKEPQTIPQTELILVYKQMIDTLNQRIESLERQLQKKDEQIDRLQDLLHNRLPPTKEEAARKGWLRRLFGRAVP
jgi:predicted RNase H-like nuclease (RuvC/YqgF family)